MSEHTVHCGGIYQHYKGNYYKVLVIAKHTESQEDFVIYISLTDPKNYGRVWARPLAMFCENVKVNGESVPRFKYKGLGT